MDECCDFVRDFPSFFFFSAVVIDVDGDRLSSGALLLFFGSIADLFGRKSMFIGSMFLFSIFCLGAGFSKNGLTIDIMNGVLGIFSASAVPPAQGMLASTTCTCPTK